MHGMARSDAFPEVMSEDTGSTTVAEKFRKIGSEHVDSSPAEIFPRTVHKGTGDAAAKIFRKTMSRGTESTLVAKNFPEFVPRGTRSVAAKTFLRKVPEKAADAKNSRNLCLEAPRALLPKLSGKSCMKTPGQMNRMRRRAWLMDLRPSMPPAWRV